MMMMMFWSECWAPDHHPFQLISHSELTVLLLVWWWWWWWQHFCRTAAAAATHSVQPPVPTPGLDQFAHLSLIWVLGFATLPKLQATMGCCLLIKTDTHVKLKLMCCFCCCILFWVYSCNHFNQKNLRSHLGILLIFIESRQSSITMEGLLHHHHNKDQVPLQAGGVNPAAAGVAPATVGPLTHELFFL